MCSIDWDLTIKALTLIVGTGTLIKLVVEYSDAQKWKKAEFLANEYSRFIESPYVQASIQMLDGFEIPIVIPLANGTNHIVDFKPEKLGTAFMKNTDGKLDSVDDSVYIRLCLDKFLFRIGIFQNYIDNRLATKDTLKPYLIYWIELIGKVDSEIPLPTKIAVHAYIKENNFASTIKLFETYGFTIN